jgi:hypothetical protein
MTVQVTFSLLNSPVLFNYFTVNTVSEICGFTRGLKRKLSKECRKQDIKILNILVLT